MALNRFKTISKLFDLVSFLYLIVAVQPYRTQFTRTVGSFYHPLSPLASCARGLRGLSLCRVFPWMKLSQLTWGTAVCFWWVLSEILIFGNTVVCLSYLIYAHIFSNFHRTWYIPYLDDLKQNLCTFKGIACCIWYKSVEINCLHCCKMWCQFYPRGHFSNNITW